MELVGEIKSVQACLFELITARPLRVGAIAMVPQGGYSEPTLSPRLPLVEPDDGIMEFDFLAKAPQGQVIQVQLPISALFEGEAPKWVKGVRIYGAQGQLEGEIYSVLHT